MKQYFIAGTDTDVGKTFVTQALMLALIQQGKSCVGFKPIAAGCESTNEGLRNSDALALQALSEPKPEYSLVNPIAYEAPVAPHLAAIVENNALDMQQIEEAFGQLLGLNTDCLLVEGAGGWRLPLGEGKFLSEFAIKHQLPVILVVGLKLGCLNHACLTVEAIQNDGLQIAGWVANQVEPDMLLIQENVDSLTQLIHAPFMGFVPQVESPEAGVAHIKFNNLL